MVGEILLWFNTITIWQHFIHKKKNWTYVTRSIRKVIVILMFSFHCQKIYKLDEFCFHDIGIFMDQRVDKNTNNFCGPVNWTRSLDGNKFSDNELWCMYNWIWKFLSNILSKFSCGAFSPWSSLTVLIIDLEKKDSKK